MNAGVVQGPMRDRVIRQGASHPDTRISGLFERFVPPDQRRKILGTKIKADVILSLTGDPSRGARIVQQGAVVTCLSCHQVGGKGRDLGPDLSAIGAKYKRDEILAHILEPSKVIDEKFATWLISTVDGDDLVGFMVDRNDSRMKLKLLTGASATISMDKVESIRRLQLSAMPSHLLQGLTAQEAADLVDYLATRKK